MSMTTKITAVVVLAASAACAQDATATYKTKCQMCHAADGTGSTPAGQKMGTRSFKDPAAMKETDAEMMAVIEKGKNKMPAYAGKLSAEEMKGLVGYVRQLQK